MADKEWGENITSYDVFIAGGGCLGCTYARYLCEGGLKVVIAEAGAQLSKKPGEHLKNSYLFQKNVDPFSNVIVGHIQPVSLPHDTTYIDTISPVAFNPGPFLLNGQNPEQTAKYNLAGAGSTYAVGGMITHWTCAIPRHHAELELLVNGEHYLEKPEEWDGLYAKAEALLCKHTDLYVDSVRNTVVKEALEGAYGDTLIEKGHKDNNREYSTHHTGVQPLPMAGTKIKGVTNPKTGVEWERIKWTGADDILGPLCDEPSKDKFNLLTEHMVRQFVWKTKKIADGVVDYEIDHAVIKDLATGQKRRVFAKYYVVAGNAILTPQILWASGIGSKCTKESSEPIKDPTYLPVGRYLTEQPMIFCQVILHRDLVKKAADLVKAKLGDKYAAAVGSDPTGLPKEVAAPNLWIPCSKGTYQTLNRKTGKMEQADRNWHCQIHRDAFSYGQVPPNIDERVVVDLRWFGSNRPKFTNHVIFSENPENTDRLGMPQPTFHYSIPEEDRESMHAMAGDMTFAAAALGGYFPGTEPKWLAPGQALHFQGTYRMGKKNDGKSVCDNNSRVWGFSNLFCGGNGILPSTTPSNPTLTSCALAYKSCQFIIQDFNKQHK